MASGIPLVAPDSGGIQSYADDGNSYLVGGSAESFAVAVRTAMDAPGLRLRKGKNARCTAERFSWPRVTDSFLQLYDAIHAVGSGRLPLQDAAPAFHSTPAEFVQSATTTVLSRAARAGFSLYSKLAARRPRRSAAAPRLVHPQQEIQ